MRREDKDVINVTANVKWIGVRDYDIRTFDIVMTTEYGTTYNSYFINAWSKTIVDVAKEKFFDNWLEKLKQLADPAEISYIIVNHTEPDHSGSLGRLLKLVPDAIVVGSGNAIRYLEEIIETPFNSLVVKDGDTLDLGDHKLKFIAAPNLHWPDTMYTWLEDEGVLFTCDSFGAHYCTEDFKADMSENYLKAYKYYFDVILKPFSRFMLRAIERIKPLDIRIIAPGHGPVLSDNPSEMVNLARKYAEEYLDITGNIARRSILIAYVSAYGYTGSGAGVIAEGIRQAGDFNIRIIDIENISPQELEQEIASHDAFLLGSPTINQNTLLPVYTFFALINPLRDKGKFAGAFGSYGWSGEAPEIIMQLFRGLKLKVFDETAAFKFRPHGAKAAELLEFGKRFALRFEEECSQKKGG